MPQPSATTFTMAVLSCYRHQLVYMAAILACLRVVQSWTTVGRLEALSVSSTPHTRSAVPIRRIRRDETFPATTNTATQFCRSHIHSPRILICAMAESSEEASAAATDSATSSNRISRTISLDEENHTKQAKILSREVPLTQPGTTPAMSVTVWEWEKPAAVVETYWQVQQQGLSLTLKDSKVSSAKKTSVAQEQILDPFGLVTWPGSVIAVQECLMHPELIFNKTVLILGAGVGVEAQAVAMMGASRVIATDIHPTTLKLLEYGASQAGREIEQKIRIQVLDLFNHQRHPLPYCDIMIVADVLYNDELANQVAKRCAEARARKPPPKVLVSDSQRFVHTFDSNLNQRFKDMNHPSRAVWTSRRLPQFTGSGVCIDCDQTYDVKARVMWIGLDDDKKPETESQ